MYQSVILILIIFYFVIRFVNEEVRFVIQIIVVKSFTYLYIYIFILNKYIKSNLISNYLIIK